MNLEEKIINLQNEYIEEELLDFISNSVCSNCGHHNCEVEIIESREYIEQWSNDLREELKQIGEKTKTPKTRPPSFIQEPIN